MKKGILIFFVVIFLAIIGMILFYYWSINHKGTGEEKEFSVKQGQSTGEVARNLKEADLISSATVFSIYAKFQSGFIQVGVYKFSPSQNMKEIYKMLTTGETSEDLLTIPEGWRVTQIDEYLAKKGIIKAGELIQIASADEGYLFPDTYRWTANTSAATIRQEMMENFNKKTTSLSPTREQVILASIIEREAKFDDDRAKIAGVYLNRLEKNMKLEADPTVQYAKGSWEPIKVADYHNVSSPYNTYLNVGLPPGPICNPGLKSIIAAIHPETDGYLFFFHKADGHAVFSATLEEHEENLKKYQ